MCAPNPSWNNRQSAYFPPGSKFWHAGRKGIIFEGSYRVSIQTTPMSFCLSLVEMWKCVNFQKNLVRSFAYGTKLTFLSPAGINRRSPKRLRSCNESRYCSISIDNTNGGVSRLLPQVITISSFQSWLITNTTLLFLLNIFYIGTFLLVIKLTNQLIQHFSIESDSPQRTNALFWWSRSTRQIVLYNFNFEGPLDLYGSKLMVSEELKRN